MIELEKIAQEAASQHSRCANCNGICPDTATNCDKSRMYVCPTYWNGYYTALDAMERLMKRLEIPITEVEKENRLGLKESTHLVQTLREFANSKECGHVDIDKFPMFNNCAEKPKEYTKPIPSNYGEGERDFGLGLFEHWQRDLEKFS